MSTMRTFSGSAGNRFRGRANAAGYFECLLVEKHFDADAPIGRDFSGARFLDLVSKSLLYADMLALGASRQSFPTGI